MGLYQKDAETKDLFEQAKRDHEVAQANYKRSRDEQESRGSGTLARGEVKRPTRMSQPQRRTFKVVREKLQKCAIRAPISGTVLKVMAKVGESYSTLLPRALFSFADDSIRRVRAEVDEWDVGNVKIGSARSSVQTDFRIVNLMVESLSWHTSWDGSQFSAVILLKSGSRRP